MTTPALPAPRWGTERNPNRETLGPQVAAVMRRLGHEPMPWQRHVLDIACEIDPATGHFWYRDVRTLEPRQSGKTELFVAKGVHRAVTTKNAQVIYTAQNRLKAVARLRKNFYERTLLDRWPSVLKRRPRNPREPGWIGTTGAEAIRFVNGAEIFVDANKEDSGHGATNDEWLADEVFAYKGGTVAQNIRPTLITVPGSQIWHQSAAGDLEQSDYWWGLVQDGRAIVEANDPRSRIAYFEWSDDPEADRADPTRWPLYMPAYGITIFDHVIESELQGFATKIEEYDRAYRGIWTGGAKLQTVIPVEAWDEGAWPHDVDPIDWQATPPAWAVDVSPDQEWASISVAGRPAISDGRRVTVRHVDHELGTSWVIERMRNLRDSHGGNRVAVAGASQAMTLKQDLEDEGFDVEVVPRGELAAACGALFRDAVNRRLWHGNDPELNEALASAAKRDYGDAWVWWRGRSMRDISPVYAATLARYVFLKFAPPEDYDPTNDVL